MDVLPLNRYIFLFIIIFICSSTDLDSISTALWVIPEKRLYEGEARAHLNNEQRLIIKPTSDLLSKSYYELYSQISDY